MSTLTLHDEWLRDFDRIPFRFGHDLASHDALQLDALREIIVALPRDQVFASRSDLSIDTDFDRAHVEHKIERTLEETLANMATSGSYVMVRKPDTHPKLRPVVELFMSELREHIRRGHGASGGAFPSGASEVFHDPMLYLFISSPNSVTPFHVDRYSTILLQLQGEKDVMIWDRTDRDTVTEVELERLFGRPYDQNPVYKGDGARVPSTWHLKRGEGVHIPFTSPHWVKNGPEVSVSVSFICKTDAALRDGNAYNFNYHARRLLSRLPTPKPPVRAVGDSPLVDATKSRVIRTVAGLRRRLAR